MKSMDSSDPLSPLGSGIVTLLLVALGLGCLFLAGQGIVTGSIDGASGSAAFTWARKPVKFVLIVLCWSTFGPLLLWAAWRVAAPHRSAQGQAASDLKDIRAPVWQSTVADSLFTADKRVAGPWSQLTAASGKAAPAHGGFAVASAQLQASTPALPEPLSLHVSRPYAVLAGMTMVVFTISAGFTAYALASALSSAVSALIFAPVALACVRISIQCVRNFFWQGPVLVLDRFGLTNYRKGGHMIAWTEVDGTRLAASRGATYLVLRFRHEEDMRAHFGWLRWLPSVLRRPLYKGFEGRVKLTSLSFKRAEVQRVAQAFLRYSRR